jgi:hypothetical protein
MEMDDDILKQIQHYYRLKQQYEKDYLKQKRKVLKDEAIPREKKHEKLKRIPIRCVHCKRVMTGVGTIFTQENGVLRAICGEPNPKDKCSLNIEIHRGKYKDLRDVYSFLKEEQETHKQQIIKNRLDLLYQLKTEEEVLEVFDELRTSYKDTSDVLQSLKEQYDEILYHTSKQKNFKQLQTSFYETKQKLQRLAKEYYETKGDEKITEMIELYRDDLLPVINRINEIKYRNQTIEMDSSEQQTNAFTSKNKQALVHLIQEPYTIEEFYFPFGEQPKIVNSYET